MRESIMAENKALAPIGVFDSGLGGISVMREIYKLMPNENYYFFGDSKNAPYGIKSVEQVKELSEAIVTDFIDNKKVKAIVIACNTATSAAAKYLREKYPELPIIGLEPAVKPAVMHKKDSRVLVMATPLTLKEEKFEHLVGRFTDKAEIIKLPAPELVEFVEKGDLDSAELYAYLENILTPYKGKVDSVVLGCTHFPFTKNAIQDVIGKEVAIFDGGEGAARELKHLLEQDDLLTPNKENGQIIFENSKDEAEVELSKRLMNLD